MLKETRLLQSVSKQEAMSVCVQVFTATDEPDKALLENMIREK